MTEPAPRIALAFMIAAAFCMVGGVVMGVAMGIAHDFTLAPVHAHINLVGWTSLALMGLAYHAWPQLAANRLLAGTQFVLSTVAAMAFPAGIWLAVTQERIGLAIAASLLWLAGAALFLVRLCLLALRDRRAAAASLAGIARA